MYTSVSGIALRTIAHNDRSSILSLWTAEAGRISVSIPADKGRKAARIRALTMPLSPVCAEVDIRPDRSIFSIRELRPAFVTVGISADPAKAMTAMLLADFLEVSLRELQPDPLMTAHIMDSVAAFDAMGRAAALNFHILFLMRLSRFLGIEPDWCQPGTLFDLREGSFRLSAPAHGQYLDETATAALRQLARMNIRNLGRFRLSRQQRRDILMQILAYYSIHHRPVLQLPSLEIMRGW